MSLDHLLTSTGIAGGLLRCGPRPSGEEQTTDPLLSLLPVRVEPAAKTHQTFNIVPISYTFCNKTITMSRILG